MSIHLDTGSPRNAGIHRVGDERSLGMVSNQGKPVDRLAVSLLNEVEMLAISRNKLDPSVVGINSHGS